MVSPWEPRDPDSVEIHVETRSSPDGAHRTDAPPGTVAAQPVNAARQAARLLRVVAWSIPIVGILGNLLTWVGIDDQGMSGVSARQRMGNLLSFLWAPLALAALIYATSFVLVLYATRVELDAARHD